jgi:hypothetical protein
VDHARQHEVSRLGELLLESLHERERRLDEVLMEFAFLFGLFSLKRVVHMNGGF